MNKTTLISLCILIFISSAFGNNENEEWILMKETYIQKKNIISVILYKTDKDKSCNSVTFMFKNPYEKKTSANLVVVGHAKNLVKSNDKWIWLKVNENEKYENSLIDEYLRKDSVFIFTHSCRGDKHTSKLQLDYKGIKYSVKPENITDWMKTIKDNWIIIYKYKLSDQVYRVQYIPPESIYGVEFITEEDARIYTKHDSPIEVHSKKLVKAIKDKLDKKPEKK